MVREIERIIMEENKIKQLIQEGRNFMKHPDWDESYQSDQELKKTQPPLTKEKVSDEIYSLSKDFKKLNITKDFTSILLERESHRIFTSQKMNALELSYLLYMTQGVKSIRGNNYATMRTVPCGGARHEFETYLVVKNVEGLKPGKYHYLPLTHELEFLGDVENMETFIDASVEQQTWAVKANVIFYWSIVPYRCEWRYGIYAHRPALMDIGHVGQNLYLACTALNLGTCCLASFDGDVCAKEFGLDNEEEFIVYVSPVGTIHE